MAKRKTVKTVKKVEQPKPIVDEVPTPAPVPEKHGPSTLFECMMRRRAKEK